MPLWCLVKEAWQIIKQILAAVAGSLTIETEQQGKTTNQHRENAGYARLKAEASHYKKHNRCQSQQEAHYREYRVFNHKFASFLTIFFNIVELALYKTFIFYCKLNAAQATSKLKKEKRDKARLLS